MFMLLAHAALPYEIPTAKRVIRAMDDVISNHVAVYDFPAWSAIMEQVHRPLSPALHTDVSPF